jgi:hypothetical protein
MRRFALSWGAWLAPGMILLAGCSKADDQAGSAAPAVEKPPVVVKSPVVVKAPAAETSPAVEKAPSVQQVAAADVPPAAEAAKPPSVVDAYADGKKAAIDPVKVNGPIFQGWTKPRLAIVMTGEQLGYMEPCGCAGLENQKGGLNRRSTLLGQLREKGWPLVEVDVGGLIHRYGQQAEIKFQNMVEGLKLMDYAAIGWGPDDLRLPAGVLASATAGEEGKPSRFVSCNVGLFSLDSGLTSQYRVVEAGGRKIGITAVLGDDQPRDASNAEIVYLPAAQGIAAVLPKLKKEADYLILLSYAKPDESRKLAKRFPEFNVIVTAGGADEPPAEAQKIEGSAKQDGSAQLLIEVGHKGMFAVVLGFYDDAEHPLKYQRVPLDSRFGNSPAMLNVMVAYQHQLRELSWAGLGLQPKLHPRASDKNDLSGQFTGSEACAKCHADASDVWSKTTHSHATDTLLKLDPPRQFDPECISCHATGWNPKDYFPYETGFVSVEATPHLKGVGCENCHGPGAAHVAAEAGQDAALQERMRAGMRLTTAQAEDSVCAKCHDPDNSPEFNFKTYWPKVEH